MRLNCYLLITLLVSFSLVTLAYPNKGPYPTPMNDSNINNFFQHPAGYAADGSYQARPMQHKGNFEDEGSTFLQYSLTPIANLQFSNSAYPIYCNIPQMMNVAYAYQNPSSYFAADSPYASNVPKLKKLAENSFQQVSHGLSVWESKKAVGIVKSNYWMPKIPQTNFVNFFPDFFIKKLGGLTPAVKSHFIAFGWGYSGKRVNIPLYAKKLNADGGTPASGANVTETYPKNIGNQNSFLLLMKGAGAYNDKQPSVLNFLKQAPFPQPNWLQQGAFMPILPYCGFRPNFIRWYTPWGAFTRLNNTKGVFVRSNGDVELPLDADSQPTPWVLQWWKKEVPPLTMLNLTSKSITAVRDDYPGYEDYEPDNVIMANQAGVIDTYHDFAFWDNVSADKTNQLQYRQLPDIWLGLLGEPYYQSTKWDFAYVNGKASEPGGQANKPYMAHVGFDETRQYINSCIIQTANSSMVGIKPLSSQYEGKDYDLTLYVKNKQTTDWIKIATLGFDPQPMQLIDGSVIWGQGKIYNNLQYGSLIPRLKFPTSVTDISKNANDYLSGTISIKAATLGSFSADGTRVANWGGPAFQSTWSPGPIVHPASGNSYPSYTVNNPIVLSKQNKMNGSVYAYVITYNFKAAAMKQEAKCLVVAEPASD